VEIDEPDSIEDSKVEKIVYKDNALHLAISQASTDTAAFTALIATHKSDINTPGALGLPPLHLAAHLRRVDLPQLWSMLAPTLARPASIRTSPNCHHCIWLPRRAT
jgi:ABC-type arginine transport system permease subunit